MIVGFETFFTLFVAYLVFGIKPGPYMMAFISLSASGHIKALMSFWLGTAMAIFALYMAVLYSLDMISDYIVNVSVPILILKVVAGIVFINIGISGLQKTGVVSAAKEEGVMRAKEMSAYDMFQNWSSGFLLTLSNPYHLIYVFSVIPALLGTITFSVADIIFINGVSILADLCIISCFCAPILLLRQHFSDSVLRRIRQGANIMMILVGIYIFYSVFNQWDLIETGILKSNFFKGDNIE